MHLQCPDKWLPLFMRQQLQLITMELLYNVMKNDSKEMLSIDISRFIKLSTTDKAVIKSLVVKF